MKAAVYNEKWQIWVSSCDFWEHIGACSKLTVVGGRKYVGVQLPLSASLRTARQRHLKDALVHPIIVVSCSLPANRVRGERETILMHLSRHELSHAGSWVATSCLSKTMKRLKDKQDSLFVFITVAVAHSCRTPPRKVCEMDAILQRSACFSEAISCARSFPCPQSQQPGKAFGDDVSTAVGEQEQWESSRTGCRVFRSRRYVPGSGCAVQEPPAASCVPPSVHRDDVAMEQDQM